MYTRSICLKFTKSEYSEVAKSENDRRLEYHYYGNTDHKLEVLGLMTNDEHCDIHCHASAECREDEKRFFGCTELNAVLLRDLLVVDADYDRDQGHNCDISQKDREDEVVLDKCHHNFNLLYFPP